MDGSRLCVSVSMLCHLFQTNLYSRQHRLCWRDHSTAWPLQRISCLHLALSHRLLCIAGGERHLWPSGCMRRPCWEKLLRQPFRRRRGKPLQEINIVETIGAVTSRKYSIQSENMLMVDHTSAFDIDFCLLLIRVGNCRSIQIYARQYLTGILEHLLRDVIIEQSLS